MTARVVAWDRNIAVIAVPLAPKFHHEEVSSVGGVGSLILRLTGMGVCVYQFFSSHAEKKLRKGVRRHLDNDASSR